MVLAIRITTLWIVNVAITSSVFLSFLMQFISSDSFAVEVDVEDCMMLVALLVASASPVNGLAAAYALNVIGAIATWERFARRIIYSESLTSFMASALSSDDQKIRDAALKTVATFARFPGVELDEAIVEALKDDPKQFASCFCQNLRWSQSLVSGRAIIDAAIAQGDHRALSNIAVNRDACFYVMKSDYFQRQIEQYEQTVDIESFTGFLSICCWHDDQLLASVADQIGILDQNRHLAYEVENNGLLVFQEIVHDKAAGEQLLRSKPELYEQIRSKNVVFGSVFSVHDYQVMACEIGDERNDVNDSLTAQRTSILDRIWSRNGRHEPFSIDHGLADFVQGNSD